jgi:Spy/CpxP family protein refolding chaperone
MKVMSLLAVATALLALPLAAQQPGGMKPSTGHRMQGGMTMEGMGMDSMMAPMMRSMATAPEHLLARNAALKLTADQITQLTALRDAAKSAHDAAAQQAMMHLGEMEQVMHTAAPDTAAVKHHFDAAAKFMSDAHWAMLSAAAQARGLLTDAQRQQVDSMHTRRMTRGGMRH